MFSSGSEWRQHRPSFITQKDVERAQLEAHLDEFFKGGGTVEVIPSRFQGYVPRQPSKPTERLVRRGGSLVLEPITK